MVMNRLLCIISFWEFGRN